MSSPARLEIAVHIGQTIRVAAIFVFAYRVKSSIFYVVDVTSSFYLYYGTETISSDKGSIDISDTFK